MFHFWFPIPVKVRTNAQTYRETYRVVERIRHNDTLLQSISDAATAYVLRNWNPDSCSRCYWVQLFKEYSKFADNVETLPNARRGCPAEQPIV